MSAMFSIRVMPVAPGGYWHLYLNNVSCGDQKETSPADIETVSGIYQIRNLANGKIYVGSGVDLKRRRKEHFSQLRNNKHKNPYLQNSFNKHGEDVFVFEILITCHSTMCIWYEQQFLDQWQPEYNTHYSATGFAVGNAASAGTANHTQPHSEETKVKIKAARTKQVITDEHKRNISKGLRKAYREGRRKPLNQGVPWNKGKKTGPLSPMHRQKIGEGIKRFYRAKRASQEVNDG